MSTSLTTAEHLSSLASAVKGKLNVLDTLPATVNGGLWLEGGGSVPIIKMYYGGNAFKITPELVQPPLATGLSVSINPNPVIVPQGKTVIATINVTSNNNGTYTLTTSSLLSWTTLSGNAITLAPTSNTALDTYTLRVSAKGETRVSADLTIYVVSSPEQTD